MESFENALNQLGLTKWEIKTYLALLELEKTTTGPLVKKCGVPQSKIYEVLEKLNSKGLVNHILEGKIKHFQASNPEKLLSIIQEKEKIIKEAVENLKMITKKTEKQSVELYEGIKSIKAMLIYLIKEAKKTEEWHGFAPGKSDKIKDEFYEWWGLRRHISGLKGKLLISKKEKENFEKSLSPESKKIVMEFTRYSDISLPGDVFLYNGHVVIIDWKDSATAILIKSKNLYEEYLDFFLSLWKQAKS